MIGTGRTTISGSRTVDSGLFLLLATLAIVGSWRVRVYFRVTVAEVAALRIDDDGSRHQIELPTNFARTLAATYPPEVLLDELGRRMELLARRNIPTSRTELMVHYSYDSSRLNHVRVFEFPRER